jgi:hypothetical protein
MTDATTYDSEARSLLAPTSIFIRIRSYRFLPGGRATDESYPRRPACFKGHYRALCRYSLDTVGPALFQCWQRK